MVIILHGTSSSGKTSVGQALCNILTEPYFYFGYDKFLEQSMPLRINMEKETDMALLDKAVSTFNKSLKVLSREIDFFILDHVLVNEQWLSEVADSLSGVNTFFVALKAPLETIETREAQRLDRKPGTAREQYEKAYKYNFDLIVDTSKLNPLECAQQIVKNLNSGSALKQYS